MPSPEVNKDNEGAPNEGEEKEEDKVSEYHCTKLCFTLHIEIIEYLFFCQKI